MAGLVIFESRKNVGATANTENGKISERLTEKAEAKSKAKAKSLGPGSSPG